MSATSMCCSCRRPRHRGGIDRIIPIALPGAAAAAPGVHRLPQRNTYMNRIRLALIVFVALIVTLGLGYAWGASGRFTLTTALDETRQLLDLAEARGHLLDARVSLYNVNFGDASREFEEAKAPLRKAQDRYQQAGKSAAGTASQPRWNMPPRGSGWLRNWISRRIPRPPTRSKRSKSPGRSSYFAIVALTSTLICRADPGSAACEITSGLPESSSTEIL